MNTANAPKQLSNYITSKKYLYISQPLDESFCVRLRTFHSTIMMAVVADLEPMAGCAFICLGEC